MLNLSKKQNRKTLFWRHLFIVLFQGMLLNPAISSANEGKAILYCQEKPKKQAKAKKMAGDLFGRAERAFNKKQYPKALKRFLCSLYAIEHEATLTNIEQVISEIEHKVLPLKLLKDYVELNPDGELTSGISEIIVDLEAELGVNQPEPEKVECEEPAGKVTEPLPVCVSLPDAAPYLAHAESSDKVVKYFSYGAMGAGAASIIAGAVFQGLSAAAKKKADNPGSYDEFLDEVQKKKQFQVGAIAGFVAGAITAGIGAAQFVIMKKRQKKWDKLKKEDPTVEKCSPESGDKDKAEADVVVGIGSVHFSLRF